mmetsp:Transcript_934/g.1143  ORF Transcript_934/g.1143 Transcript_934/m.1143 type:complete len:187 (+) Transcript_934:354-914(+)
MNELLFDKRIPLPSLSSSSITSSSTTIIIQDESIMSTKSVVNPEIENKEEEEDYGEWEMNWLFPDGMESNVRPKGLSSLDMYFGRMARVNPTPITCNGTHTFEFTDILVIAILIVVFGCVFRVINGGASSSILQKTSHHHLNCSSSSNRNSSSSLRISTRHIGSEGTNGRNRSLSSIEELEETMTP